MPNRPSSDAETVAVSPTKAESKTLGRGLLYPLILLALPFLFFLPGTLGEIMLGDGDAFVHFLAYWSYVSDQWGQLSPPFWTPHIFCGFPLMADPLSATFHPLVLFFLILPPVFAMNLVVLLYYSLAGLFTYWLAREEGLTPEAGLLAGVSFSFCGFLIGHQAITPVFITAASFPVLFYVVRVTFRKASYGAIFSGILAILFLVLNGHPQFTFYAAFFASLYALYLLLFEEKTKERRISVLKRLVVIAVLGTGIAMFQILPTAELAAHSQRASLSYADFVGRSLPPGSLVTSLISTRLYYAFRNEDSEAMLDVGGWVLLLALLGILTARKAATFWIFLLLFASALYVGDYTPLYRLMYWLPGFDLFRLAYRNGIAVDFAVVMLAAQGLSAVQARPPSVHKKWQVVVAALIPVVYFFTLYIPGERIYRHLWAAVQTTGNELSWSVTTFKTHVPLVGLELAAIVAGVLLTLFLLMKFTRGSLIGAVAVAIALSHFWGYRDWIFAAPREQVEKGLNGRPLPVSFPNVTSPRPSRLVFGGPFHWIRLLQVDRATWREKYVNWGGVNINALYGIHSVSGYTPLILTDYSRLAGQMHLSGAINDSRFFSSPALDLLNVEFIMVPNSDIAFPGEVFSRFEVWQKQDDVTVYRNPGALGFFRAVEKVEYVPEDRLRPELTGEKPSGIDFSKTAVIMEKPNENLVARRFGRAISLDGGYVAPTKIVIRSEAREELFLTLSQTHYPGWFATVDGKRTELYRVNGVLSGLVVPSGSHRVVLRFVPVMFWIGVFVALLSLAVFYTLWAKDLLRLRVMR